MIANSLPWLKLFSDPLMLPPPVGAEAKSAKKLSFSVGTTGTVEVRKGCEVREVSGCPVSKSTKSELLVCDIDGTTLDAGVVEELITSDFP